MKFILPNLFYFILFLIELGIKEINFFFSITNFKFIINCRTVNINKQGNIEALEKKINNMRFLFFSKARKKHAGFIQNFLSYIVVNVLSCMFWYYKQFLVINYFIRSKVYRSTFILNFFFVILELWIFFYISHSCKDRLGFFSNIFSFYRSFSFYIYFFKFLFPLSLYNLFTKKFGINTLCLDRLDYSKEFLNTLPFFPIITL